MVNNDIRFDLCQELKQLLAEWHALETNKAATERDFARLRGKILHVTTLLEQMDGAAS